MSAFSRSPLARLGPGGRWLAACAVGLVVVAAALVQVTTTGPRVSVRWAPGIDAAEQSALEARYDLRGGRPGGGPEWQYELGDWSRENIAGLVGEPAVADTAYIDRQAFTAEPPQRSVGVRQLPFPFNTDDEFRDRREFFQLQSLFLLLGGVALLVVAGRGSSRQRQVLGICVLLAVAATAWAFPLDPSRIRMGDLENYLNGFEDYLGVLDIRFEAHLTYAVAGRIYQMLGAAPDAPARAMGLLADLATGWFVLSALALGMLEQWSARVVRYLGLALLAPAALLYYGYQEIGYLSLNLAAFPLLMRGLRDGAPALEGAGLLAGLGAALHGFGLLALGGAMLAAASMRVRPVERLGLALRLGVWGTAAYVGWIAIYVLVLDLPVALGHVDAIPWRPWLQSEVVGDRVNAAILSATGGRDLLFTAWVVGVPLLAVVGAAWPRGRDDVRPALWYALPSIVFVVLFWPMQGLGVEMDLLVAAFPALYGLAWVCARTPRSAAVAAALLVSGHLAFWRILLDGRFVN